MKPTDSEDYWHFIVRNRKVGPMAESAAIELLRAGSINSDSLAWTVGLDEWTPVSETWLRRFVQPPPLKSPAADSAKLPPLPPDFVTKSAVEVSDCDRVTSTPSPDDSKPPPSIYARASKAFWATLSFSGLALSLSSASSAAPIQDKIFMVFVGSFAIALMCFPVCLVWCAIFKPKRKKG